MVAFPSIANLETLQAKARAFGRYVRLTAILTAMTAAGLYWLAPWIVRFFFGEAFTPATSAARVLIVAGIPMACNTVLGAGLKGFNRPLTASAAEIISLVVTAVALAVLLPRYEILGAAWASLLAYSASCAFMLWSVRRHLGMTLMQLFRPTEDDWHRVLAGLDYARTGFNANR
jgi:O-antigen/teichoic acid export membrane protein